MNKRGRPVLGAFAGLFFGLFLALDLVIFGILPLDSNINAIVPVIGLIAGVALGIVAPFGARAPKAVTRVVADEDIRAA